MPYKHSFSDIMLCFLFELLHEIWGIVPAIILLVLHFLLKLSVLYFFLALAIWLLVIAIRTAIIAFANRYRDGVVIHQTNKNPHSAKTSEVFKAE